MRKDIGNMMRTGVIAILISAPAAGQPARAVDATCKLVLDAMAKQRATPTHLYATESSPLLGGKPKVNESIYAGGAIYIRIKGQWKRSPLTLQAMQKQQEENQRNAKSMTCRYLRDETVNGEAAAVYFSQGENEDSKSDSTLWVSKRTGLPLRSENDLDTGSKTDRMHVAIRYEYGDVRPPAGVK
jgi:hypothetical protein